jgi:hypothetical protein
MTLIELGLGDLAAMQAAGWHQADEGCLAYEQATEGQIYCSLSGARISAQSNVGDFLKIDYTEKVERISTVYDAYGLETGPGLTVIRDRVLVLPYGKFAGNGIFGHLNPIRQEMIQAMLHRMAPTGMRPACLLGEPFIQVHDFQTEDGRFLMLVNSSHDTVEKLRLVLPESMQNSRFERLDRTSCRFVPISAHQKDGATILDTGLAALETVVLAIKA